MGFTKACPIPRHGSLVYSTEGTKIGHITSGTFSPVYLFYYFYYEIAYVNQ